MTFHVDVKPELLRWARERAGADIDSLVRKFSKYREWESGDKRPTLKQLESFANVIHVPVGYLFLSEPPKEPFPISDFRTVDSKPLRRPSPDLLDTIYLCQERQDWYREFIRVKGEEPLPFIRSAELEEDIVTVAARIRNTLELDPEESRALPTSTETLQHFIERADAVDILVMVSGIVGNNAHRRLDPGEFRGFTLVDDLAPLIFLNGADTKAAQMFTLAHELAHLWLGRSALSNSSPNAVPEYKVETWCNQVAAELLVPLAVLREEYRRGEELPEALIRLTHRFKVSELVLLRRIYDIGCLTREQFQKSYDDELKRLQYKTGNIGEDFYAPQTARLGRRFARAVVADTLEGRTMFRDAFHMLGFSKLETFCNLAKNLGIDHRLPS